MYWGHLQMEKFNKEEPYWEIKNKQINKCR